MGGTIAVIRLMNFFLSVLVGGLNGFSAGSSNSKITLFKERKRGSKKLFSNK